MDSYKKSIEADPEFFDANYNLGVMYWNNATEFYKKANNMDLNTYQKSGAATVEKGNVWARQAMPYFEKAYALKKEESLKNVLRDLYRNLKLEAKMKALQ
jgi:hypothetical protein